MRVASHYAFSMDAVKGLVKEVLYYVRKAHTHDLATYMQQKVKMTQAKGPTLATKYESHIKLAK